MRPAVWRSVPLAIFLTSATALAADAQSSDGSFTSPRHFMQRDGEVIYGTVCQGCHMPTAQGAVGAAAYPALAADAKLAEPEYPVLIIVNGSKGMPPFGALLDDQQVAVGRQLRPLSFRQFLPRQRFARRYKSGASVKRFCVPELMADQHLEGRADRLTWRPQAVLPKLRSGPARFNVAYPCKR